MREPKKSQPADSSHALRELTWEEWLAQNGAKLLLFARQQTRSQADAEDILQESLIKLAVKVKEGIFVGGQSGWIPFTYTAIRRSAIDLGRKNDRRTLRENKAATEDFVERGEFDDPWFALGDNNKELGLHIQAALKEIPENFAEIIQLKIWGEQTFAEISKILDISQNTAASRYRYGIEALKKILNTSRINEDI